MDYPQFQLQMPGQQQQGPLPPGVQPMAPPPQQQPYMSPEDLQKLLQVSDLASQQGELSGDRQMAAALRGQQGQKHTTGWGAALGGLGDILRQVSSQHDMNALAEQIKELRAQKLGVIGGTAEDAPPSMSPGDYSGYGG
jgi:hypothetical protein